MCGAAWSHVQGKSHVFNTVFLLFIDVISDKLSVPFEALNSINQLIVIFCLHSIILLAPVLASPIIFLFYAKFVYMFKGVFMNKSILYSVFL